jgi:hypothetical protein
VEYFTFILFDLWVFKLVHNEPTGIFLFDKVYFNEVVL